LNIETIGLADRHKPLLAAPYGSGTLVTLMAGGMDAWDLLGGLTALTRVFPTIQVPCGTEEKRSAVVTLSQETFFCTAREDRSMPVFILEEVSKLEQIILGLAFRSTASTPRGGSHDTQARGESCKIANCKAYKEVCQQCEIRVLDPKEL
jgi:hypothetical protein